MTHRPTAADRPAADRPTFAAPPLAGENLPAATLPGPGRRALITGVTGQDGSYLAELLLSKGYDVHGLIRRSSGFNTARLDHLYTDPHEPSDHPHGGRLTLHHGDVTDGQGLAGLIADLAPDEIYNLAAQSHVRVSFDSPVYTHEVVAGGALKVLEAARRLADRKDVRVYQASSSEMFGRVSEAPQSESTPFHPRSPYACAKACAFHQTVNHRESYGLFAVNGILFNHESPRRGETFVTRKITRAATRIAAGVQEKLYLGNTDSKRDWGYAPEYVEAMWRMLQATEPRDYVVATGRTHTVQDFLEAAFARVGLDWRRHVETDPRYFRPAEVDLLLGDATKAERDLGWTATTDLPGLVANMCDHDADLARREAGVAEFAVKRAA